MDRREHHRAQLSLPVRLRWTTPLGQKKEICETLDVSRGGLSVPCAEAHEPGVALWVTLPYDDSLGDGQPEILAKVVRAANAHNSANREGAREGAQAATAGASNPHGTVLAMHFEIAPQQTNGHRHKGEKERRSSARRAVALPIRVRPEHIKWCEEAMTVDVCANGMRFLSSREYLVGENLLISFESSGPWSGATEFRARVVRFEAALQGPALAVSVVRMP